MGANARRLALQNYDLAKQNDELARACRLHRERVEELKTHIEKVMEERVEHAREMADFDKEVKMLRDRIRAAQRALDYPGQGQ